MTKPLSYKSATAFRQALETRIMNISRTENVDIQRLRRQLSFDRLLCRLFTGTRPPWILKGGYAMELRLKTARTTRDIDLALRQNITGGKKVRNNKILELLQSSTAGNIGDYFSFLIGEPIMDLDAAPYGGGRFPVEARMDGRTFARFHIDVALGDTVMEPLEMVQGRDWLGFAGISTAEFPSICREQQFAEKYHAYSVPRGKRENSRVRDLVDMLLLIHRGRLHHQRTKDAIKQTFGHRDTHTIPKEVPPPPASWEKPFTVLAQDCGLNDSLNDARDTLAEFISRI
jgi:hypothetical protein